MSNLQLLRDKHKSILTQVANEKRMNFTSPETPLRTRSAHIQCDATMYHMTIVTVRDLRYDFPRIENLLRQGEEIQITKRSKVIARLVPERPPARVLPDFMGRLHSIYGDKVQEVSGAEIIRMDRDRY